MDSYDGWQRVTYRSVNLDDAMVLMQDGRNPSPSDPLFHQQVVYAVCTTVYAAFQKSLARHLAWGFDHAAAGGCLGARLWLRPHAFDGQNAYYDKVRGEICFGYYQSDGKVMGRNPPFGFVFTCFSHDIVAHEVTHPLIDGLRERLQGAASAAVMRWRGK